MSLPRSLYGLHVICNFPCWDVAALCVLKLFSLRSHCNCHLQDRMWGGSSPCPDTGLARAQGWWCGLWC